ncbi:MAG: LptF/LptG family permease [Candidatus Omnitrophota bacterium]
MRLAAIPDMTQMGWIGRRRRWMKIIDRAILLELLAAITEGAVLFSFVFLLKPVFNLTGLLVAGASFSSTVTILFSMLPSIMMMTLPMAVLLSCLLVYGRLALDNELTALQAAGYSALQLLTPALIIGCLLTLTLFWWGQRIAPKGLRIMRDVAADVLQNTATGSLQPGKYNDLRKYVIFCSDIAPGEMRNLRVFEKREDPEKPSEGYSIAGVISAPTGSIHYSPENKSLQFDMEAGVLHQMPSPDTDVAIRFRKMLFSVSIPDLLRTLMKFGRMESHQSNKQLHEIVAFNKKAYIKENKPNPTEMERQMLRYYLSLIRSAQVELTTRSSLPSAALIMAFIGALLGMQTGAGKRSSSYAATIGVIFVYHLLMNFGKANAMEGTVSVWFGLWIPNFVSLLLAVHLYLRTRRV